MTLLDWRLIKSYLRVGGSILGRGNFKYLVISMYKSYFDKPNIEL